jgi:nucleoside-diphosphate-sugar epimerase
MRILVSGATGFIGSFLIKQLINDGHDVSILVRNYSSFTRIADVKGKLRIIAVDYKNLENYKSEILENNPELFFHLGWFGVENTFHNDDDMISINIRTSMSLCKIILKSNIKSVIALGSQAEYGPYTCVINENHSTNPTTLYGIAKLSVYNIFNYYLQTQGIRYVWLRLFSSYGPSDNPNWLIPYLINTLAENKSPALTKCEQIWDYIYIDDVISALVTCAFNNNAKGVYNLGSGIGYPLKMVITKIRDMINPAIQLNFGEISYRKNQIMILQADNTKLKIETGWQPFVELKEGLMNTINWYLNIKK